mmetsp:Transcript_24726/g.69826  ORF Transcript_24726/g.69826 Transcript_24726/m.69826 type:complete len:239 (+) Transcript_24726:137-853(+)
MSEALPVRKLILVGNGSVGKSSLISRFVDVGFAKQYRQTIGIDFFEKALRFREDAGVRLQVWDVGGQNVGSKMLGKYVFGSHIIALCYDVTSSASLADLSDWLALARPRLPGTAQIFLVGNKIDLVQQRQVCTKEHERFIRDEGLRQGFLVSARSGDSVLRCFYRMAALSAGVRLSEYDMALLADEVLSVQVTRSNQADEADEVPESLRRIEEEDQRLAQERRREFARHGRRLSCLVM